MKTGSGQPRSSRTERGAPKLLRCLKWAHMFAQGTYGVDQGLHNPVFERWLSDCAKVILAADGDAASAGMGFLTPAGGHRKVPASP